MAGVTDRPFRELCLRLGAGMAVGEMVSANPALWHTAKSSIRRVHVDEPEPRAVQIAGTEPDQLAAFAQFNVEHGAQIIDINMGCPAKKVCAVAAGSALLRDETKVARLLQAVIAAVDVPVTLKIRTGWDRQSRNALAIAHIAEDSGVQMLTVHGRTRADKYKGLAEYDSIAEVKAAVGIPVIANGDIDTPQKAREVLELTGADGLMIARPAQGNPWIFREIQHYLQHGTERPAVSSQERHSVMMTHIRKVHAYYGDEQGVRIARKHIRWYVNGREGAEAFWKRICRVGEVALQLEMLDQYLCKGEGTEATLLSKGAVFIAA